MIILIPSFLWFITSFNQLQYILLLGILQLNFHFWKFGDGWSVCLTDEDKLIKINWYSAASFQLFILGEWIICKWSPILLLVSLWLVLICSKVILVYILKLHVSSLEQVIRNTGMAKKKKNPNNRIYENWKAWIIYTLGNWPLNN